MAYDEDARLKNRFAGCERKSSRGVTWSRHDANPSLDKRQPATSVVVMIEDADDIGTN